MSFRVGLSNLSIELTRLLEDWRWTSGALAPRLQADDGCAPGADGGDSGPDGPRRHATWNRFGREADM